MIIEISYEQEIEVVRCRNSQEEADSMKGLRQWCTMSLPLFNLYVKEVINKLKKEIERGIRING